MMLNNEFLIFQKDKVNCLSGLRYLVFGMSKIFRKLFRFTKLTIRSAHWKKLPIIEVPSLLRWESLIIIKANVQVTLMKLSRHRQIIMKEVKKLVSFALLTLIFLSTKRQFIINVSCKLIRMSIFMDFQKFSHPYHLDCKMSIRILKVFF